MYYNLIMKESNLFKQLNRNTFIMDRVIDYFKYLILLIPLIVFYIKYKIKDSKQLITKVIQDKSDLIIGKDILIKDERVYDDIINKGEMGLAESYMNGYWTSPDIGNTLYNLMINQDAIEGGVKDNSFTFIYHKLKLVTENFYLNYNNIDRSRDNITKHYDIGNDLYEKMLGKTMQYTCAYYNKPDIDLDEAQLNKMELVAKKLDLKQGMEVLDLGCGFGTMANHLAKKYKVKVTGVTLSDNQVEYAKNNLDELNVNIINMDYRNVEGQFDRVYSVGILEHVGSPNYEEYFNKCYDLLKEDGVMLCHTMGIAEENNHQNEYFASTYIFPGGELPDINNITRAFCKRWRLEDFQNIGISYSKTFDEWRKNIGDWSSLENYDITFRRMWEYYLHLFSENFRHQNFLLWQFVLTKKSFIRSEDCDFIRN